jgi:hypothetical protein
VKPPKVVYVGTYDYDVRVTRNLSSSLLGETETENEVILLRKGQSAANMQETLLHELLHAILFASGISKAMDFDHDKEETLVVLLSPWLNALIQDNPGLLAFLTERKAAA